VEELPGLSDAEAVKKAQALFDERKTQFSYEGFEVWERARMIAQYPPISLQSDADDPP